ELNPDLLSPNGHSSSNKDSNFISNSLNKSLVINPKRSLSPNSKQLLLMGSPLYSPDGSTTLGTHFVQCTCSSNKNNTRHFHPSMDAASMAVASIVNGANNAVTPHITHPTQSLQGSA